MRALRIIDTGLASASSNIATSLALLESHDPARTTASLRFYSFHASVLLGRSQNYPATVDTDYCRSHDIDIVRRVTGGGAVYMDPSMLAWDFVTETSAPYTHFSETIGGAIGRGLRRINVPASFRPPHDLTLGGRKISGTATASFGRTFLHQGTLLIEDVRGIMARALCIPRSALDAQVTSLAEAGCLRAANDLQVAISEGLAETFDLTPVNETLSACEISLIKRDLPDELELAFAVPSHQKKTSSRG